jgi:gluconolactonase
MKSLTFSVVSIALLFACPCRAADDYQLGPESQVKADVPSGKEEPLDLGVSTIFPGATHEAWVYVPAQYNAAKPACLMIFQDGGGYVKRDGQWRVPVVFDNLIHAGKMPTTIALFINPGIVPAPHENALPRFNRSLEYDGLGDRYARFLIEEAIPALKKKWNISDDPNDRGIGGASSGAIAAFTAAWERPDAFRRVFSTIGTYVGLRGGDEYPTWVRKCEPRPLRVFLQDGSGDLNIYGGDWWVANQAMLSALTFSGYETNHVWGDGGHNGKHGGAIFPDAMTWLWKDHGQAPIARPASERHPLAKITTPGQDWTLVGEGYRFTEGPTASASGDVFFADGGEQRIYRIGLDHTVSVFAEKTGGADGMCFGPDDRLYAACNRDRCIAAWDVKTGARSVIASDLDPNDCVVNHAGHLWFTDHLHRQIWHVAPDGKKTLVAKTELGMPNGIELSPDQSLLYVADTNGQFVWSWQVQPDGTLAHGQRYFHMHYKDGEGGSGADGLALDNEGRLYVCTKLGIQICDQAGRVNGIMNLPPNRRAANLTFGGADFKTLYVAAGDKVYRRALQVTGVRSAAAPQKPKAPRL